MKQAADERARLRPNSVGFIARFWGHTDDVITQERRRRIAVLLAAALLVLGALVWLLLYLTAGDTASA
jgi:hypothetical protein